jgi:hypothetical protein
MSLANARTSSPGGGVGQPQMTLEARQSGLEALRAVLRRRHPGFDVVFNPTNESSPATKPDSRIHEKHEAPAGTARASQKTGGDGASELRE